MKSKFQRLIKKNHSIYKNIKLKHFKFNINIFFLFKSKIRKCSINNSEMEIKKKKNN